MNKRFDDPDIEFIHFLSIGIWIGSIVFFTFVAAPKIFKALPRQMAGDVVGRIFPQYYKIGLVCGAISIVTLILMPSPVRPVGRILVLSMMVLLTAYAVFRVGPRVRRLKNELKEAKAGVEREMKERAFRRLHGFSMVLNMIVLMVGFVFLFLTASAVDFS
ncbi:MAG: DUF4149 domain-containing protein [Nitrospiria bacterium]